MIEFYIIHETEYYNLYKLSSRRLLAATDYGYFVYTRQKNYWRKGYKPVHKKDFDVKASQLLRNYYLVEVTIDLKEERDGVELKEVRIELVKEKDYDEFTAKITKEVEKTRKKLELEEKAAKEKKIRLKELREKVERSSREAYRTLIDLETDDIEMLEKVDSYLNEVKKKLENIAELKVIKHTKKVNKNRRLELYKNNIRQYITEGRYISLNRLCKDLKINRQTFYNYGLREFVEELIGKK